MSKRRRADRTGIVGGAASDNESDNDRKRLKTKIDDSKGDANAAATYILCVQCLEGTVVRGQLDGAVDPFPVTVNDDTGRFLSPRSAPPS